MDFLKNIINRILENWWGKTFRKQVQEEKKKKYLFRDEETKKHSSPRNTYFRKKRRELSQYTSIFQDSFEYFHNHLRESQALWYMGAFLLFLTLYIVIFSPYFKISPNKVLVEADTPGIDVNIAYRSLEDIYGKSIFLLNEEETAISLKKSLKNISRIRIEKLYPNGVKVLISGAPIRYIAYVTGVEKRYGMSENGVLVPDSALWTGATDTLEIYSEALKSETFLNYKQVLSDEKMLLIRQVYDLFHEQWSDFVLGKSRYLVAENELHLSLESGTKILITFQDEAAKNVSEKLLFIKRQLITLDNYITSHRKELSDGSTIYIDARIDKKLFVCRDKEVCKQNLIVIYGQIYAE